MMMMFVKQIMMEFLRWWCTIDRSPLEGRGKAVVRHDNDPDHDEDDDDEEYDGDDEEDSDDDDKDDDEEDDDDDDGWEVAG